MRMNTFLIAGGNSTLLVQGYPSSEKRKIVKKYLGKVEQIGFIEKKGELSFLNMMGGELCINGTLALARNLGGKGPLFTSGLENPVLFKNNDNRTSIEISINYKKIKNIVLLEGIGYILLKKKEINPKQFLEKLCDKFSLPAFGILYSKDNQIFPFVYVKETQSLFEETACGSGSIAFSILSGADTILQPTSQPIFVNRDKNSFYISAEVTKL